MNKQIWIVDFGSQYTQLIVRKTRELHFSSDLLTVDQAKEKFLLGEKPNALVLSGGPQSVFEDNENYDTFFNGDIPVLGVCYGMQLMGKHFGGVVEKGTLGEYGNAKINFEDGHEFFDSNKSFNVWMSHSDHITKVPPGFDVVLKSQNNLIAGIKHETRPLMAFQFHPEVEHSENGKELLNYFFKEIASLKADWKTDTMLYEINEELKKAKNDYVLCAFSGGVDSLVAAACAQEIIGNNLYCFFVDNGLLRPQDYHHIELLKKETKLNIEIIDAKDDFLIPLEGVDTPETKRKIIGKTFIDVFEKKVHQFEKEHQIQFKWLLQGTLFPDVIESVSPHKDGGKSVTIKSHHNVGGLPERMKLSLLEPLKFFFKDEVRKIGMQIGLNKEWVFRHPFPGPGIGVRILGEVTQERIRCVQESDQILFEEMKKQGVYDQTWQAFTVFLPVKTVGVKGDSRAYEYVISLRMVNSSDGMTAKFTRPPYEFLEIVSSRITNEVSGITRVVYDITSKPPGTIEWE